MRLAPSKYCDHLTAEGYHPRSNKHGDFLSQAFVADLLDQFPKLAAAAESGKLVYALNFDVQVADRRAAASLPQDALKDLAWNIDLALGPPGRPLGHETSDAPREPGTSIVEPTRIRRAPPAELWLVVDAKGVMTEHGKARRNRQRDLTALWAVMHTFYPDAVVGALVPINIAKRFRSPLRVAPSRHPHIERIVGETLAIFRAVRRRRGVDDSGIEGLGCFVVEFSNLPRSKARLRTKPPAPQPDDPIRYENFLRDAGRHLLSRFGDRMG